MTSSCSATEDPWSISVKTVGGGFEIDEEESHTNSAGEKNFTVTVSPDDGMASLHDKIEGATGLKASQQRLIYRGRLIGKNGAEAKEEHAQVLEPKIKDIAGLSDGQTIHLVKRRDTGSEGVDTDPNSTEVTAERSIRSSLGDSDLLGGSSSGGGGSLLAALLGLSSLADDSEERDTARQRWGWRSSRLGRSRRPHYRLTAEDLEIPDPGSMEPVRQGLMTLHTLLPHAQQTERESPLEANREWYRGQWIDCRDTVNQWLEATIVEVMSPDDVLPPRANRENSSSDSNRRRRLPLIAPDPAVSASDMEGRRRLLLEPLEPGEGEEEEGELVGFRRRGSNRGVQLLLLHYNGWPHRWDEWIRSDSERIRPFRTRTRHPSVASAASPTPQSLFIEAPRTNLRDGDETEDRWALLPELGRAVTIVNDMLTEVVSHSTPNETTNLEAQTMTDLPWLRAPAYDAECEESSPQEQGPTAGTEESNIIDPIDSDDSDHRHPYGPSTRPPSEVLQYNRRQLQNLATVLDRLGRTLTDAAPQLAALAQSLPEESAEAAATRDGGDGNPRDLPELEGQSHPPLGGLLSLWSRERRRHSLAEESSSELAPSVDPDHTDYVSGLVNTSRGEVRSGPRGRSQPDDVASLLGAYLAAASLGSISGSDENENGEENGSGLGRLLRERGAGGGGGGGIDIHIHAVVTAPGGGTGGLGLATLGGATPTATTMGGARNLFSSARERSSRSPSSLLRPRNPSFSHIIANNDDDHDTDMGLFSELYSENPTPVDPNGSPEPGERRATMPALSDVNHRNDDTTDFLARISNPGGFSLGGAVDDHALGRSSIRRTRRSSPFAPRPPPSRRQSEHRRSSMLGRLFRSRRSRSNNDNRNSNNNPESP